MPRPSMILALALLLGGAGAAQAAGVADPAGDFVPAYTGPKNGDMDVLFVQGVYNGVTIRLDATPLGEPVYRKLGFTPASQAAREIAAREEAKLAANPAYRTSPAVSPSATFARTGSILS